MSLEKFRKPASTGVKFTEDEEELFNEMKTRCREKGINHRNFLEKVSLLYKLR